MVRNPRDKTEQTLPVRKQLVWAGDCPNPKNNGPKHTDTRVYSKHERTRYCVCNSCGHTWKQVGPVPGEEAEDVLEGEGHG